MALYAAFQYPLCPPMLDLEVLEEMNKAFLYLYTDQHMLQVYHMLDQSKKKILDFNFPFEH